MKVFIMRHGEAEMLAASDKARHLTEYGRQQVYSQAEWLKSVLTQPEHIIVSPYTRAIETFEQIDVVFSRRLSDRVEVWDGITPYGNSEIVSDYLATLAEKDPKLQILIVSHLPLVGKIVAELCGKNSVDFYPATIAQVEWDTEHGHVEKIKFVGKE
ncbi:phosphohistidine phosphatase SixA [Pasteurellaceae bacterium LIM206]|nr:phosphohistidine phosphatase SixA [Pasteurellaceae bacterium LIM206]